MAQVSKRLRQLRRLKRHASTALRHAQQALRERNAARNQLLTIIEQVKDATRSSEARDRGVVERPDGLSPVSGGAVDSLPAGDEGRVPEVPAANDAGHS